MMSKSDSYSLLRRMSRVILVSVAVCSLWLFTTMSVWASVNKIADAAGILDQNQVRSAGASLRYPLDIYTTRNFSGTSNQFEQRARSHLTNANMIVMAISTSPSYVTVVAGSAVPLSNAEADSVISSFRNGYQSSGHDFTSATISALQTLENVVPAGPVGGGRSRGTNPAPAPASGSRLNGLWCLVGLVVLGLLAFFVIKGRRSRGLPFNQPQYDQPYQGNYPPNYGPGYPPQQGGINPLAAGGLGAAAGGLLGYELGKQQGEREAREEQGYGGNQGFYGGNGGEYGGGSVGDFGGDFGGGSSGDFGGGSSGDFGGGGDFGSSGDFGDSGDSGGGSSGDF